MQALALLRQPVFMAERVVLKGHPGEHEAVDQLLQPVGYVEAWAAEAPERGLLAQRAGAGWQTLN